MSLKLTLTLMTMNDSEQTAVHTASVCVLAEILVSFYYKIW